MGDRPQPGKDGRVADDQAVPFVTRTDVSEQTPRLMIHFGRWGMEVHAGKPGKVSKSEILFCPKPLHIYERMDTHKLMHR